MSGMVTITRRWLLLASVAPAIAWADEARPLSTSTAGAPVSSSPDAAVPAPAAVPDARPDVAIGDGVLVTRSNGVLYSGNVSSLTEEHIAVLIGTKPMAIPWNEVRSVKVITRSTAHGSTTTSVPVSAPVSGSTPGAARPAPPPAPRGMGISLVLGPYTGFGAGIRGMGDSVSADVTVGWSPILVGVQRTPASDPALEFFSSVQVNAEAAFGLLTTPNGATLGLQGGAKYNTIMGPGGGAGVFADVALRERRRLRVVGGLVFWPDGEDGIRKAADLPEDASFGTPGPGLQYALSLQLVFGP